MSAFVKVILLALVLLGIAFLGLAIKLFFNKNAKLPGGSCCGCNGGDSCEYEGKDRCETEK